MGVDSIVLGVAVVGLATWNGYQQIQINSLIGSVDSLVDISKDMAGKLAEIESQIRKVMQ